VISKIGHQEATIRQKQNLRERQSRDRKPRRVSLPTWDFSFLDKRAVKDRRSESSKQ